MRRIISVIFTALLSLIFVTSCKAAEITFNGAVATVENAPEGSTLIGAFYSDSRLIATQLEKGSGRIEMDFSGQLPVADKVKVFLWDMNTIRPLSAVKEIDGGTVTTPTPETTPAPEPVPTPTSEITPTPEIAPTPTPEITPTPKAIPEVTESPASYDTLYIHANNNTIEAEFEDNESAAALVEKLKQGDVSIDMHDYGGFEKVGSFGFSLPRNDTQITTEPGDIILYSGNQLTIHYGSNSWSYTRLAKVKDMAGAELKAALGDGNVTVTLSLK